jgi:cell division transport system permease protein
MRFGFFLRESLRAMRRNAAPSFAALAAIMVTLIVVGVFIPVVQATRGAADGVSGRVMVDVFMKGSATAAQEAQVKQQLEAIADVQRVVFESKGQALAQEKKQDPAGFQLLSYNPLPDTFHVYPRAPNDVLAIRAAIDPTSTGTGGKAMPISPAIEKVSNGVDDTRKLLTVTRFVTITAAALSILLIVASVLLIGNTIRLSLYARRREVEVMKLVGATDWFIRWPFVIEGTIVGALGALAAIVVLGLSKIALLDPLANNFALIAAPRTISFVSLVLVLVAAGVGVSAVGSGLSLRRFLRV